MYSIGNMINNKKGLTLKLYFMLLWYMRGDIPAPGCLIRRRFINWNTGGVNDS